MSRYTDLAEALVAAWDEGYRAALFQSRGLTGPVRNPYLDDPDDIGEE